MDTVTVRALEREDNTAWLEHWSRYLDFYQQDIPQDVTDDLFERLLSPASHDGLVAESDGRIVGFVHFLFHDSTWSSDKVCYLEDLYVSPDARGKGVGRKLIEAVYKAADRAPEADGKVYWLTNKDNARAQLLYNRIGKLSDSIRYVRP